MSQEQLILFILLAVFYAAIGLAFGSFSNVLIYRLPNNIPLTLSSRSFCPKCKHELAIKDNIPLFSFLFLGGKCRYCKEPISKQYPLIEASGLFIFLSSFLYFNFGVLSQTQGTLAYSSRAFIYPFILLLLLVMAVIDYRTKEVPLSLQITLGILVVASYITVCILTKDYLLLNLIGFGASAALLLLVYFLFLIIKKQEGMGLGDIIVYSLLGLLLNVYNWLLLLLISSLLCSVIELIKQAKTKQSGEIPFIPYIFVAAVIVFFFGDFIVEQYLGLVGITYPVIYY